MLYYRSALFWNHNIILSVEWVARLPSAFNKASASKGTSHLIFSERQEYWGSSDCFAETLFASLVLLHIGVEGHGYISYEESSGGFDLYLLFRDT